MIKRAEIKAIWDWIHKYAPEQDKNRLRPWVNYTKQLEKKIDDLEKRGVPNMFEAQKTRDELNTQTLVKIREEVKAHRGESLKKRLYDLVQAGKVGSVEWVNNLKWNGLTEEQAVEIASSYPRT